MIKKYELLPDSLQLKQNTMKIKPNIQIQYSIQIENVIMCNCLIVMHYHCLTDMITATLCS